MQDYSREYIPEGRTILIDNPDISVRVLTFNHAEFIDECLESVFMQQIRQTFEVCIGEDDSNDNTREICIKWAEKYPNQIRLFLRDKRNKISVQGKPGSRFNFMKTLQACTGKYIAYLDGDDKWTDPEKLQKQFDFLETHPDFVLHSAEAKIISSDDRNGSKVHERDSADMDLESFLRNNPVVSSTAFFRNTGLFDLPPEIMKVQAGDWFLWVHLLQYSGLKAYYSSEEMSVYRVHKAAMFSGLEEAEHHRFYYWNLHYLSKVFINEAHVKMASKSSHWHRKEYIRGLLKSGIFAKALKQIFRYTLFEGNISELYPLISEWKQYRFQ